MERFKLILRTPEQDVFDAEVLSVDFGSEGGDMQVFAGHASTTTTVLFSPVIIETDPGVHITYMVRRGLFLFDNEANEASLLALSCEAQSELSEQSIKEYMATLNEQLEKGESLSQFQVKYLEGEKLAVEKQLEA